MILGILIVLALVVFLILFGGAAISGIAIGLGIVLLLIIVIASGSSKNKIETSYDEARRIMSELEAAKKRYQKGIYSTKEHEARRRQILGL